MCAQVISRGMRHRRMGSHELNMESSRSHSIMTVYCDTPASSANDDAYPGASLASMGKISFVDLVGNVESNSLLSSLSFRGA